MPKKTRTTIEYGDFQTPLSLARDICRRLSDEGLAPAAIIEPTCGVGAFLHAGIEHFPSAGKTLGIEINPAYVDKLNATFNRHVGAQNRVVKIVQGDFFATDWAAWLQSYPEPLLIIGNPPWVTNAELGALGSANLPEKSNFQHFKGVDAITGKSNFDISEYMLSRLLDGLKGRNATLAMLCKTVVARKVLAYAWKNGIELKQARLYKIDARKHFGAAVDAGLLVCHLSPLGCSRDAFVYQRLEDAEPSCTMGYRDLGLVANIDFYEQSKHLREAGTVPTWRSGVKHDCAKVMELRQVGAQTLNGLGEAIDIEEDYLYPMLKSSDLASGNPPSPKRWMIVTQRSTGADTRRIQYQAPKTWRYLQRHAALLSRRSSSIYKNRPPFSVFGVGDYTFAPWKVAISGFYKSLIFNIIGNEAGKPIVLDDTCYFLPCQNQREAQGIASLLNSRMAREFFSAFIFWDAKRPITTDLLRRLDLWSLARVMGQERLLAQQVRQGQTGLNPLPHS
ncbi:MAG: SAM-dependent DNA methyltransferase [Candidatus Tectomicrobia bacterium]|nr:SAM-dependent DNA methyltransferase [Candidatus Tectomicrobia bacterium]